MGKINWYPGHIKNAKLKISQYLKVIDLLIEVVDSRVPLSSNIIFDNESKFISNKKRLLLFSKTDLVEKKELNLWKEFYLEGGYYSEVIYFSIVGRRKFSFLKKIKPVLKRMLQEKQQKHPYRKRVDLRVMVLGFPNVGKSTVLNTIAGYKKARVANLPGVTRGVQWYKISDNIFIMDTPGIIFPERISRFRAYKLMFSGIIPLVKGVVDEEILLLEMIPYLKKKYPDFQGKMEKKYGVSFSTASFLEEIAKNTKKSVEWVSRKMLYSFYKDDDLKGFILDILENESLEERDSDS